MDGMNRWPSLFVSHGAPTLILEDTPTRRFLAGLGQAFPRPRAVVVVSAHFMTERPTLGAAKRPPTVHDFYGFPDELYEMAYPAKGDPDLARAIQARLGQAGIEADLDPIAGLDHGAWVPLKLMYPEADLPVVPLSVCPDGADADHVALGHALAPLRDEGVLILASGGLTHNLREYMTRAPDAPVPGWTRAFADAIESAVRADRRAELAEWRQSIPEAAHNHPSPEHFLPFLVALGAATLGLAGRAVHRDYQWGVLAHDAYWFD